MAVLKLVREEYRNIDAIDNLVHYVLDKDKMPNYCFGGIGISMNNPAYCMNTIKKAYGQTTGKQAEHFILAFDKNELNNMNMPIINKIAYEICEYFQGVQILYAVHEVKNTYYSDDYDNDALHIHFVLNTVNLYSGQKFRIDFNNEFSLKNYIENILFNYKVSNYVKLVF